MMAIVGGGIERRWAARATVAVALATVAACAPEPRSVEERAEPAAEMIGGAEMAEKPYRMSEAGMERVRQHEAFEPQEYDDGAGNETIGYGHLVLPGEDYEGGITEAEAMALFREDVDRVVTPALDKVTANLTQNQVDALGSFIYNVGPGAFERFALEALNDGRLGEVTDEMMEYVNGGDLDTGEKTALRGLIERRKDEIALFHHPIPLERTTATIAPPSSSTKRDGAREDA